MVNKKSGKRVNKKSGQKGIHESVKKEHSTSYPPKGTEEKK